MTSTATSIDQQACLEVNILVKCKNSLAGRAYYGITSSKLEITE